MRRVVMVAVAAVLVGVTAVPAAPDARVRHGDVTLWVRGRGTTVARAGGSVQGHQEGVQGSLIAFPPGRHWFKVTGWRAASRAGAGQAVSWTLNRRFDNGTRLCIEFNNTSDQPCAKIHA